LEPIFCEADQRFFLLFLEKEGLILFFLKKEPKSLALRGFNQRFWVRTPILRSRTTLFASFSGKRRADSVLFKKRTKNISPAGFNELECKADVCTRKPANLRMLVESSSVYGQLSFIGRAKPETASSIFGKNPDSAKQNKRFLLLFLEKEGPSYGDFLNEHSNKDVS
jgi:hypothetical protein